MSALEIVRRDSVVIALAAVLLVTACRSVAPAIEPVLLFDGTGTSPNDVAAMKAVLEGCKLTYSTADSSRLNAMSESELSAHRLLIVPGGNYVAIGESLTPATSAKIRSAVQGGLNYLGICAGGLLAGDVPGGLNLTDGVKFDFYALVNHGVHKAAVEISGAGAPAIEHYWEDGPQFTGWGAVVGRYPDGTPAIVEGKSGKGWAILSGTHPEAPESWRRGLTFTTSASAARAYAASLVDAALKGTSLPHD